MLHINIFYLYQLSSIFSAMYVKLSKFNPWYYCLLISLFDFVETILNPIFLIRSKYLSFSQAPATHPINNYLLFLYSSVSSSNNTISDIHNLPPTFRIRWASLNTFSLDGAKFMTQLLKIRSTVASARGIFSMSPSLNSQMS